MKENDAEHLAFQEFIKENNLDPSMHPLHLLYLNNKTNDALVPFKAGYSAAKAQSEWVSVEERLPENPDDMFFLAVFDTGSVEVVYGPDWLVFGLCELNAKITHWMPLPKAPE